MKTVTIKANGQTLSMSSDDALALEAALIQARRSPNEEVCQMTLSGGVRVMFSGLNGGNFSQSLTPMDGILAPVPKPMYSANDMTLTDC
ncbi:hypothetical protein FK216_06025 [Moraxellaceae bacterium AER2_44_116]|nr:hypothetical protein [Moraxellaceae bacterium]TQC98413.1 hypothetical protein FK216_06025 [Moraxellaceae bacterium AER2_44_116]